MKHEQIQVSLTDGIGVVRLHRLAQRNALNRALMQELTELARAWRRLPELRAVVLTGTDRFFSAGMDLNESAAARRAAQRPTLLQMRELIAAGPDLCQAWEDIEVVTIAAIEGYCIGGACALALACDFRLAGASANMRLPEVPLGMNMSWQSLPRLTALVGPARAKRFTIFGEATPAATLLDWGLIDAQVDDTMALTEALAWANKLAALPPLPVRMSKEAINASAHALNRATSVMDRDQFLLTYGSADQREGVQAFFDKRLPRFVGN